MTKYQKIVYFMTKMQPEEVSIKDGPITYNSTQRAHNTLASYMVNAKHNSLAHRTYAVKAYKWLKLLRDKNINLQNKNN